MKPTDFTTQTFDVAGTLIDFETGILNWFRPHLKSIGIEKQDDKILRTFSQTEAYYLQIMPKFSFTEILPVRYSDMMGGWNHHPLEENGKNFQNSATDWPHFPGTIPALEELKGHFRLVAVNKSDTDYLRYMSNRMGDPFDDAVTCDQVGSTNLISVCFRKYFVDLEKKESLSRKSCTLPRANSMILSRSLSLAGSRSGSIGVTTSQASVQPRNPIESSSGASRYITWRIL